MCLLKVYSNTNSFKSFKETTRIPVYSIYEKGDKQAKRKVHKDFKISFDVSEKEWDDFKGQVQDAIDFLIKYRKDLKMLFKTHKITTAYLDFPIYSRLQGDIVNQNDHLPNELILLAGKLSLGIEISIYSKEAFDKDIN
jgi:hypothetical protein